MVLVSVFLTWITIQFEFSGRTITQGGSLGEMVLLALQAPGLVSLQFIFIVATLVVVGALVSFKISLGGILPLIGVGYFYYEFNRQLSILAGATGFGAPTDLFVTHGIGLLVASIGAIVVLATMISRDTIWSLGALPQRVLKRRVKDDFPAEVNLTSGTGSHTGRTQAIGIALAVAIVAAATGAGYFFLITTQVSFPGAGETIPPTANFQYSWIDGRTWQFHARSVSSDNIGITLYKWDFGDGTSGEGGEVTHSYVADGTYTVTLTVFDRAGNSDSISRSVEVATSLPPPGSGFIVSVSQVAVGTGNPINAWNIRFESVPIMLATAISLVVFDANGATLLTATPLTSLPSNVGSYFNLDASGYIAVGDYILLAMSFGVGRAQVPPGSTFSLVESASFAELVSGTLQ